MLPLIMALKGDMESILECQEQKQTILKQINLLISSVCNKHITYGEWYSAVAMCHQNTKEDKCVGYSLNITSRSPS